MRQFHLGREHCNNDGDCAHRVKKSFGQKACRCRDIEYPAPLPTIDDRGEGAPWDRRSPGERLPFDAADRAGAFHCAPFGKAATRWALLLKETTAGEAGKPGPKGQTREHGGKRAAARVDTQGKSAAQRLMKARLLLKADRAGQALIKNNADAAGLKKGTPRRSMT
jgi:hypothetical protein